MSITVSDTGAILDADPATSTVTATQQSYAPNVVAQAVALELHRLVYTAGQALLPLDNAFAGITAGRALPVASYAISGAACTSAAIQALQRLRMFSTWKENWDAEGAPAPDLDAIEAASNLLGFMKSYQIDPTAMLDAFGKPMFLFNLQGVEAEINLTTGDELDYLFVPQQPGEELVEVGVPFDKTSMPASLDEILRKLASV